MRIEAAAKRYAQAAFAVALEQGEPQRWLGDLGSLGDLVAQPEAAAVLQSDRVPAAEKDRLLEAALPGRRLRACSTWPAPDRQTPHRPG